MTGQIPRNELCNRFSHLYTGAISDVMDELGLENRIMTPGINPLSPDMTVAGISFPVVGRVNRDVDPDRNIENILQMLEDAPPHTVLTYQANDDQFAHIGGLSATALENNNVRGAVIDGGARDVTAIRELDFPVFAEHTSPADAVPRWEIQDWNVEAVVGGVPVQPGDVVVGDADGVVVVPEAKRLEVLRKSEEVVQTEEKVRKSVEDGTPPREAYDEFGKF